MRHINLVETLQNIEFKNPGTTVDLIIENDKEEILLIKRKNEPFKGYWALPGGFLEYGKETLEQAGKRELEEETCLKTETKYLELLGAYSSPDRDPRGHVISHIYVVIKYLGEAKANDDAKDLNWFSKNNLPKLAFDHNKILEDYFNWKERRLNKNE